PATPLSARFFGNGTLVEARAGPAGAELTGLGPVPAGHVPPRFRRAGRALVLIRPDAVRLLEDGGPPRSFSNPSEAPETPERPASPAPGLHFTSELVDVSFACQAGLCTIRPRVLRPISSTSTLLPAPP